MGLETSTTIQGLNIAWPLGTDPRSEGDNHLRLVKTVLKNVFDDSNANTLLFKVMGVRFSKAANTVALEAVQGSVLRGQLIFNNTSAAVGDSSWAVYDNAGVQVNRVALAASGFSLATGTLGASAITATGKVKGADGEFGPSSGAGARGINLISGVDALSGRLMFSNGVAGQSLCFVQQDTDNSLSLNVAATYGSSSGTRRYSWGTDGVFEAASNIVATFGVGVTRGGIGSAQRGAFNVDSSFNPYIARYLADGITFDGRLLFGPVSINYYPQAAAASNSLFLYDGQATAIARVRLWWDSANAMILRAVNAAGTELGYIAIDNSGVLIHREGASGSSYPVIATDKLDLLTYTGSTAANLTFPIGTTVTAFSTSAVVNGTAQGVYLQTGNQGYALNNTGLGQLVGTWRCRGTMQMSAGNFINLFQRTA